VADESVVVTKSRPEKAGNSLEEKTGTIRGLVRGGCQVPKALALCEGRKFIGREPEREGTRFWAQAVRRDGALFLRKTVTGDLREQADHRSNPERKSYIAQKG